MTSEAIGSLPITALKAILYTNHVNAGMILEKSDLVSKVKALVSNERRERERQWAFEQEEAERVARQRALLEQFNDNVGHGNETILPPKIRGTAADLERTGLCVICQDEEANIALVDCGSVLLLLQLSECQ
jgi:hypothetical protein